MSTLARSWNRGIPAVTGVVPLSRPMPNSPSVWSPSWSMTPTKFHPGMVSMPVGDPGEPALREIGPCSATGWSMNLSDFTQ